MWHHTKLENFQLHNSGLFLTTQRPVQNDNVHQNVQQTHTATSQLLQAPGTLQDVVEVFTKQQRLAMLPPQNIPIFKGDPLEYQLFIRVEDKTDSA